MGRWQIRSIKLVGLCAILALLVCPALSTDKKAEAPAKPAAAARPAAAPARPAGGAAGGAVHGTMNAPGHATGGATTTTHGPTTGGATTTTTHGPTTGGPITTTHGATTTTTGSHTTTGATTTGVGGATGAGHPMTGVGGHGPSGAAGAVHAGGPGAGRVPAGHTMVATRNGGSMMRRPDGRIASVHDARRGMDVHRGLDGNRRVMVERADHSRVFVEHGGRGYVQRPYMYHGHEYARRSYYYGGHYYHNYYGRYYYRGVYVNPYYPAYYYGPGFYGWAYNPWAVPVTFAWGWGGNPWYGYYGGYFTPYPVYAGPAFWLTDYMVAASLQEAYQSRPESDGGLSNPAPLTPETKALITDEVKRQIALENAEAQTGQTAEPDPASSSIQRALSDGVQHVFVAGQELDVVDASGRECAISQGDALQLAGQNPPDATEVDLIVLASKGGRECPRGDTVSVGLPELQDMQNHMRETIDQGMAELQKKQGQGGLPAAPASARVAPTESVMALNAPPPPPQDEIATQLKEESKEADAAEKEAAGDVGAPATTTASAEPPTVALGQTPDQVMGALGRPKSIMDLGSKKIYVYPDMKVIFHNGKVTDIQ